MEKENRFIFGYIYVNEISVYKILGIRTFKKFVPFGDYWILFFNKIFSKELRLLKSKENAIVWVIFTLAVELLHLIAFFIMIWLAIRHLMNEEYLRLIRTLVLNLIINIYPIMVQRYNRFRKLSSN